MELSEEQEEAKRCFLAWWGSNPKTRKPFFRMDGYAGTGKTYSIKSFIEGIDGVVQVAPTGKAALVARQKTGRYTSTVHKAIYTPKGAAQPDKDKVDRIEEQMKALEALLRSERGITEADLVAHPAMRGLQRELDKELGTNQPIFKLNPEADIKNAKLIYLTEASMAHETMAKDLLSFGVPILLEGDPGQLPPVGGDGYFMRGKPDVMLMRIHRQAADSPILKMATRARRGEPIPLGDYGEGCAVVKKISAELALAADQIIVGRNATRHKKNHGARIMKKFISAEGENGDVFIPRVGEKLICLRNNDDYGIVNGSLWTCRGAERADKSFSKLELCISPEENPKETLNVKAHSELFRGLVQKSLPTWLLCQRGIAQFDFGYAITCHKSQGSQWDFVVVYDESNSMPDSNKWLYTALTRAAKRLIIVTQ